MQKSDLQRIEHEKIYIRVANQLKQLVHGGVLKPGEKLPNEIEMAQQMGISRPSIREALRILEAVGMVQSVKGVGTFIAQQISSGTVDEFVSQLFAQGDPLELIEARDILESGIAALVAERATPDDVRGLEAIVSSEGADLSPEHLLEGAFEFHNTLARLTGNSIMIELMRIIGDRMRQRIWRAAQPKMISALAESGILGHYHRQIVDAIKAGSPEGAREAMRCHMAELRAALERSLEVEE